MPLRCQYRPWARNADHYVCWLDYHATLRYVPRGGWRLGEIRTGGPFGALVFTRPLDWREIVKRIMRVAPEQGDDFKSVAASQETKLLKGYPTLVSFATVTRYDDGEARTPGWWMLKVLSGNWQLILKDRDSGLQLSLLAPTIDDVFKLAETMLQSDKAPWELDQYAGGRSKKKK